MPAPLSGLHTLPLLPAHGGDVSLKGALRQPVAPHGEQVSPLPLLSTGPETPCPPEAGDPLTEALVVSSVIGLLFLVLGVLACTKGTGPPRYTPRKCSGPQV